MGLLQRAARTLADRLGGDDQRTPAPSPGSACPQCGAPATRKIEYPDGFGPKDKRQILCGACGYEYPRRSADVCTGA